MEANTHQGQKDRLRIIYGDCALRLLDVESASVQLVVTSPPYDNLRTYLFANAVKWCDDVSDEEKGRVIEELKTLGIKPRKTFRP